MNPDQQEREAPTQERCPTCDRLERDDEIDELLVEVKRLREALRLLRDDIGEFASKEVAAIVNVALEDK